MSGFSFDFSGFSLLERDLKKIADGVKRNEKAAVMAGGHAYQADVQKGAPVDQGPYRASIRTEPGEEWGHPVALIGTPAVQACQLEYGGFIRAKNAPYLIFQIDGQWIQTKQVYQPPHPHWRPAWDQNLPKYRDIMLSMLNGTLPGGGIV